MFFRSYGTNNGRNNPIILNSHFVDISEKNLFELCVCVRVCVCVCVCVYYTNVYMYNNKHVRWSLKYSCLPIHKQPEKTHSEYC